MKKKILFVTLIIVLISLSFPSLEKSIEVIVKVANIRSLPSLKGDIIGKAVEGEVFIIQEEDGDWYKILLQIKNNEFGYLHKVTVKEISIVTEIKKSSGKDEDRKKYLSVVTKSEKPKKEKKSKKYKKVYNREKLFSGFYLKGGLITSPSGMNFSNSWMTALGFDSPIGKYLTWGLEFQPYYRSDYISIVDVTIASFEGNIFLNLKAGMNMGGLINFLKFLDLYIGGGAGSQFVYQSFKYPGGTNSEFVARFAWHLLLGSEFNLGKINIITEFQFNKTKMKNLEPATFSTTFFMVGIRF